MSVKRVGDIVPQYKASRSPKFWKVCEGGKLLPYRPKSTDGAVAFRRNLINKRSRYVMAV